ncbi:hypothetical protein KFL_002420050 [Klebsormidium nitens]|uniref:PH domain-containing protein n=1 Tax=Klebsormidium nitens TaxID=105231 RepID=A0A1Y1I6J4_KLENI|nr:hypothetical protein KFL_002420050 [Klebsormidium nitens]|eukprot:GAQ85572.1 hypothetical protein KFL_002420050 [Klebsormidium nitens]
MDVITPGNQMASPLRVLHTGGSEGDALEDSGSPMQKFSGFAAPTFASLQRTNSSPKKQLSRSSSLNRANPVDDVADLPSTELPPAVLKMEGWETDALEDSGSPLRKDGYAAPTFSSFKRRLQEGSEKPANKNPEITRPEDLLTVQQALTMALPQSARRTPRPTSSSSDWSSRRSSSFGSSQTSAGDHLTPRLLARSLSLKARELANQPGESTGGPSKTGSRRQSSFSRALTAEEESVVSGGSASSEEVGGRGKSDSLERVSEGDESEKRSRLNTPQELPKSNRSNFSEGSRNGGVALGQRETDFGSPPEQRYSTDRSSDGEVVIGDSESSLRNSLEGDVELRAFAESVNAVVPGTQGAMSPVGIVSRVVDVEPIPTTVAVATPALAHNAEELEQEKEAEMAEGAADVNKGAKEGDVAVTGGDGEERSSQEGSLREDIDEEQRGQEEGIPESAAGQVIEGIAQATLSVGPTSENGKEFETEMSAFAVDSRSTSDSAMGRQYDVLGSEEQSISKGEEGACGLPSEAGRLVAVEEDGAQAKQLEEVASGENEIETEADQSVVEEGSEDAATKMLEGLVEKRPSEQLDKQENADLGEVGTLEEGEASGEAVALGTEKAQELGGKPSLEHGIRKEGEKGPDGWGMEQGITAGLEKEKAQEREQGLEDVVRQDDVIGDEQSASRPDIPEQPLVEEDNTDLSLRSELREVEEREEPAVMNETGETELLLGKDALTGAGLASESGNASAAAMKGSVEVTGSSGTNDDANTVMLSAETKPAEQAQLETKAEENGQIVQDGITPTAAATRSAGEGRGEWSAAAGVNEELRPLAPVQRRDSCGEADGSNDAARTVNEASLGFVRAANPGISERSVRAAAPQNAEKVGVLDSSTTNPAAALLNKQDRGEPTAVRPGPGEESLVRKNPKKVTGKKNREVTAGDGERVVSKEPDADVQGPKQVPAPGEGFEASQRVVGKEDASLERGGETGRERAVRETSAGSAHQGGGKLCADEDAAESGAGAEAVQAEESTGTGNTASGKAKARKIKKGRKTHRQAGAVAQLEEATVSTAEPVAEEETEEKASLALGNQPTDGVADLRPKKGSGGLSVGAESSNVEKAAPEGGAETPKKDKKKKGKKHRERSEAEGSNAESVPDERAPAESAGQESGSAGSPCAEEEKVDDATAKGEGDATVAKDASEFPRKPRKKNGKKIRTTGEEEGLEEDQKHFETTAEGEPEVGQKEMVHFGTADMATGTLFAREESGLSGSESVGKEGKRKKSGKSGKKKRKSKEGGREMSGKVGESGGESAPLSGSEGREKGKEEADGQSKECGSLGEAKGTGSYSEENKVIRNVSQESVEVVSWPEDDLDDTCHIPPENEQRSVSSGNKVEPGAEGARPTGLVTSPSCADEVSEKLRLALAGRRGKRGSAGSLYYPEQALGTADVSAVGGEKTAQGGVPTDRGTAADADAVKTSANAEHDARSPSKKPSLFLDLTSPVRDSVRPRASSSAPSSPGKHVAREGFSRQQELDAEWAAFTDRVLSESRAERTERAEKKGRADHAGVAEGADETEEIADVAQGSDGSADVETNEERSGTVGAERLPAASFAAKMASLFRKDTPSRRTEPDAFSGVLFDEPLPVKQTGLRSSPDRDASECSSEGSSEKGDSEAGNDAEDDFDNQMRKVSWADENGISLEERLGESMHFRQSKFNELVTGTEREQQRDRRQLSPPLGYVSRPDLAAKKSGAPAEKQFRELLRTDSGRAASVSPRKGGLPKPAWVPPSGSPRCADVGDSKHANVHYAAAPNSGRFGSPPSRTGSGIPPEATSLPRTRNGTPRFSSPPPRGTPPVSSPPGRATPRVSSPSSRGAPRGGSPPKVSPDVPYHKMHTCIEPVKLFTIGAKVERTSSQSPEYAQSPSGTPVELKKSSESGKSERNSGSSSTESSDGGFWDVQLEEGRRRSSKEKRVTFADVTPGGGAGEGDVAIFEEPKFEDVALREGPAKPAEGEKETGGLSGLARKFKNVMNGKGAERSGAERKDTQARGSGESSKKTKGKWELIVEQEDAEIDEGASLIAEAPEGARARAAVAAVAAARSGASLEAKKAELALRKKRTVIEHRRERARATKELEEVQSTIISLLMLTFHPSLPSQLKKNVSAELSDVSVATERLLRRFHVAQSTCQELSELLQGALKADAARAQAYAALASSNVPASSPHSRDSDVTAACDAARGLASSVAVSADEANEAAKPAFDKIVEMMKALVAEEKRLTWESTSRGEPAIRKQWEALARAFEAHERACSLLETPEASPAFGGNELQKDDPWLAGKALQERIPPVQAARTEAALMVASNAKSLRATEADRIDAIKEALLTYGPWAHTKAWDGPLRALETLRAASDALSAKRAGEARLQETWAAFESAYTEKKEILEATALDPFQSARARFQGPLKRKIGWNGKWVPSHAVLTSAGNLHFFHVDASEQPTSRDADVSLHISMATVRAHSDGVTLQLACYTHQGKKEDEILLRAPSERERARWGAAFREATVEAVQQEQQQREEAAARQAKERERLAQLAIEKQVKEFKVAAAAAPEDLLKTSPISPDAAAGEAARAHVLELSSQKTVASARKESLSKKEYYGEAVPHKQKKSNPELAEALGRMRYLTVEEAGNAEEDNIA